MPNLIAEENIEAVLEALEQDLRVMAREGRPMSPAVEYLLPAVITLFEVVKYLKNRK